MNAVDANAFVLALLLGPPVAGLLVQGFGGSSAIVVIGLLLAVTSVTLIGIPEPPVRAAGGDRLLASALDGLRYTWHNPVLRGLALSVIPFYFAFGALTIALPVIVLQRVGAGPAVVGAVWGMMAVTGGVAALLFGRRDSSGRERAWLAWAMVGTAFGMALLLPAAGLPLVLLAMAIAGFCNGPLDIALFTLRQRGTDPAWMGRAFAVSAALNGAGTPIGAALSGLLVTSSLEASVLLAVGACLLGALVASRSVPTTISATAPDAAAYSSPRP
jgi:MFS family permease